MRNRNQKVAQITDMEELFALGGFIKDTTKQIIKNVWFDELPSIVRSNGVNLRFSQRAEIFRSISNIIDTYESNSSEECLYSIISNRVKCYLESCTEIKRKSDDVDDEMNFTEN